MALKHYNPTSPAQRGLILVDKSSLHKGKPVKALTEGKRKTGGRNNKGHVTSRGIGGGCCAMPCSDKTKARRVRDTARARGYPRYRS